MTDEVTHVAGKVRELLTQHGNVYSALAQVEGGALPLPGEQTASRKLDPFAEKVVAELRKRQGWIS
jgi:hypothetical protein